MGIHLKFYRIVEINKICSFFNCVNKIMGYVSVFEAIRYISQMYNVRYVCTCTYVYCCVNPYSTKRSIK